MRIAMLYSGIESFNYFTDRLYDEFVARGNECFIFDLENMHHSEGHTFREFSHFASEGIDLAIAFDGIGIKEELFIDLWDSMNTKCVNILMDHPLRFHPTMLKHPRNYVQYCCDRNHVEYVKRYFGESVKNVGFLPHAGTLDPGVSFFSETDEDKLTQMYLARPMDVLFSGTYYEPSVYLKELDLQFGDNAILKEFYHTLSEKMISTPSLTTEQAVLDTLDVTGLNVSQSQLLTIMACAERIDWMARMHYRKEIIHEIALTGADLWLIGRGWERHPDAKLPNYHIISGRVPFAETLPEMGCARINLNVMPWFKDGTHDRIFNILLQGSLPLTDGSGWLRENFMDGLDLKFYDLEKIEEIPAMINHYLDNPSEAVRVIKNGAAKVRDNFTWKNIVDVILEDVSKDVRP